LGGGGQGGIGNNGTDVAGTVNTGSGGGGAGQGQSAGASGGSGVVIFSLPAAATVAFSGGVTESHSTSGLYTTYTVTAAGASDTVTIG